MNIAERLNQVKGELKEGVQVVSAPQLFPTPQVIADKMVNYLNPEAGDKILEPSAGTGNLLKAMIDQGCTKDQLSIAEINGALSNQLAKDYGRVYPGDFLDRGHWELGGYFDKIIMNPPFKNGEDIKHIKHALSMLTLRGTLVALCANGPRQRDALLNLADHWEDLPAGSFKNQGTNVNTALLVIRGRI